MPQECTFIPKRAMVIQAHPDDIEFSYAGTIAYWLQKGCQVCYVLCTSGDVGIADLSLSREQVREIRERETLAAAKVVGVTDVVFLREPDGSLVADLNLRKKLVREIRRFQPEVVMCGDPTVLWVGDDYINHPDHRAANLAAIDATFPAAGQPHLFQELQDEGLQAHKPRKMFISNRRDYSLVVDISQTIGLKIQALKCHESQLKDWDPTERIEGWARESARDMDFEFGEAWNMITLVKDEDWVSLHPEMQA